MKILSRILAAVSLLAVFSCSKDIEPDYIPTGTSAGKTYIMTVVAEKGETGTRALDHSADGKTLNATWKQGEKVYVYNMTKSADLDGFLEAQESAVSTTLIGSLDGTVEDGDTLLLKFLGPDYIEQDGTLEYIAANCDYATAEVVASIPAGGNSITASDAIFKNQQAIVKFTLNEKDGSAIDFDIKSLKIVAGVTTVNVTANPSRTDNNVLYVAIPAIHDASIYMSAILDDYGFELRRCYFKNEVTFRESQYYEVSVKMSRAEYVLTYGELYEDVQRYDDDCFEYLILADDIKYHSEREPIISGNRVIDLNGHTIDGDGMARLFIVPSGSRLTIVGSGTLTGGDAGKSYDSDAGNENGGAIYNDGTLIINGDVTITGNTAVRGGGIYQNGTLEMSSAPVVSENTGGNVYLESGKVVNVGGTFDEGASIGVTLADGSGTVTSGYSSYHDTPAFFSSDDDVFYQLSWKDGEACVTRWYTVTAENPYANLQELVDETGLLDAISLPIPIDLLISSLFDDPESSVSAISYNYRSTDLQGEPIVLSALIYVPDAAINGSRTLTGISLTNHGTIASNAQCPTMSPQFEGALAWKNYAVVMPDYYGFGVSADLPQAYLDAETTARGNIDAYLTAVQLLEDRSVVIPEKLYSFGYSQGGFNSMANLKYVTAHPELDIKFDKVLCGGSPFDVELTWNEYTRGNFRNSLAFVPMTVVSINETRKLNIDYSEFFKGDLLANYQDWILSKQYTTSQISDFLSPDPDHPTSISDILNNNIITGSGAAYNSIISIARSYSLTSGWTPPTGTDTDIVLFHSEQDDTVPFTNLEAMKSFLDSAAPGSCRLIKGDYGGHMTAVIWFVLYTINEW